MAKPSLKDGYYKLSYELQAAVQTYGFGRIESYIITLVMEVHYGYGKRRVVYLSPSEVGEKIGHDRQNVHRAIRKLERQGVLEDLGGQCYCLVKNYEKWELPGQTGPQRLEWIKFVKASVSRATQDEPLPTEDRDDLDIPDEVEIQDNTSVVTGDYKNPVVSHDYKPVVTGDYTSKNATSTLSSPVTTDATRIQPLHIEERAELNSIQSQKEAAAADSPATIPLMKIPETLPELEAWAKAAYPNPMPFEGSKLSGLAKTYPIWWLYEAIQTGMLKATNPSDPWGLIAKILRDWESEGRSKVYAPKKKAVQLWQQEVKATPEFLAWKAELRAEREKKAAQAGGVMHA